MYPKNQTYYVHSETGCCNTEVPLLFFKNTDRIAGLEYI
jgi:hypothetical protein